MEGEMESMDISSINDCVKEFLHHKLQNAKDCTGVLQENIENRNKVLAELQKQLEINNGLIKVKNLRKNCFHGNYVIKLDILNDTNIECYNAQCMLCWNSSEELRYTTSYYVKDGIEKTKKFPSNSLVTLVIIVHTPDFKTQTNYTLNGIITYNNCLDNEKQSQSVLPQFTLDINDFTSNIELKLSNLDYGNPLDILDILTFYRHDTLVIYMKNADTSTALTKCSLKNRLFVDCKLQEINFRVYSKSSMEDMYFADSISDTINGALLQLCTLQKKPQKCTFYETEGFVLHIYTSCKKHLYNFLHYLQAAMEELQLHFIKDYTHVCSDVNKELKSRLQLKKQLTGNLIKEIHLQNVIGNIPRKNDFVLRTRRDLIDLEYETDIIVDEVLP